MNKNPQFKDPVISKEMAIKAAGNMSRLAGLLKIKRSSVSEWGEKVPGLQAYRIIQIFPDLKDQE